ncbi:DUF2062 domain-containing protein [Stappia sp. 28M-7]|jgi:uncharacterized protein (DUF2062 family)|uniref:DUF2062 domain-containing protein n=1 Tax=Stappia sp. 28M-7 TaxID=2762596 RepID=UPI000E761747|nr:DUF2062 domain-containing protein [Stappia sp. 28M-7]MBC2859309.1 DUF2062 domain-containing protein [Stappia sp. 28M-7]
MLFKRRDKPTHLERLRVAVWPRHSFARSARYFSKRVLRLTASPHAIAMGFAAGAFASITPFIGLHFLLSFVIAFIVGGNMVAAALGTVVGNPLTFPFIWASTYKVGSMIIYGEAKELDHRAIDKHLDGGFLEKSLDTLLPLIKPMLVGAVPLGLLTATFFYFLVFYSVRAYQRTRRQKLSSRKLPGAVKGAARDADA